MIIFHLFGEKAPTYTICVKNCVAGDLLNVTTYAKFQNDIFRVTILQKVELSIFLLISEWLLQHCSATALPVILIRPTCPREPRNFITGSAVTLHCCQVHSKINRKM